MTDRSGWLGDWRAVLAGALAVLTAGVVTVMSRTGDPARADSYLSEVRAAVVEVSGHQVEARDGMRVPNGATVRTGATGAARVTTAGRDVYLGALTTVIVVDGVAQRLDRGQVMVDARKGPHLDLMTRAGLAHVDSGALARAENGPKLRFLVYSGVGRFTAAGRQVTRDVPEFYQLQAPYGGIPLDPTALVLTPNDVWERRLANDLVTANADLEQLVKGLNGPDGQTVLTAARAVFRSSTPPAFPDRATLGERALSVAVAQTSRRSGSVDDHFATVRAARDAGGSWGVVAAIVDSRVSAVSALLSSELTAEKPLLTLPSPGLPGLFSPQPSPGTTPTPSPTRSGQPPTSSPTSTPTRSPSKPPTSPSAVDGLVTTVNHILGSATPTPSPTKSPKLVGVGIGH